MSPPKQCAVCGDKALGHNFSAVTCESCKAFFRRNALTKKELNCPFEDKCIMTVVTRRFCQKCRMKKCLEVGMKSENIMSEEDKLNKRRKIESNRAKRRLKEATTGGSGGGVNHNNNVDVKEEQSGAGDSSDGGGTGKNDRVAHRSINSDAASCYDTQSCHSFDSNGGGANDSGAGVSASSSTSRSHTYSPETLADINPELMTGEEMVEYIVSDPDKAAQSINRLMRTRSEAMTTLEKIINSQKDALRLIAHLINYPGDALKIISKIMNSPLNALTVFTKFMSSPTDALEIISKIVDSPKDVLQFIKQLMDNPEDGVNIMNKFMNSPAEALKMLNNIFNGPHATEAEQLPQQPTLPSLIANVDAARSTASPRGFPPGSLTSETLGVHNTQSTNNNTLIHSMLNSSPPLLPTQQHHHQSLITSPSSPLAQSQFLQMQPQRPSPFTPSPQSMSLPSPLSVESSYQSPSRAGVSANDLTVPTPPAPDITDFNSSDVFDIKTFMQNSFSHENPGEPSYSGGFDGINSLESVLTEVIRIEFQAFNNLPTSGDPAGCVKQEQQHQQPHYGAGGVYEHVNGVGVNGQAHSPYMASGSPNQHAMHHPQAMVCNPGANPPLSRDLNEAEQFKLRELKLASEALYYPVDDEIGNIMMMGDERIKPEDTRQDPKLLQVINLTAVAIKRLIKMAKKINAFRNMCQEDQVALLKGGCTEMMIMRSVMTYDDNRNTWKIPHTKEDQRDIRAEVLKLAKGNVYEEHLKFIRTFDEKWRLDENIILIMCAIVLFTPNRPRMIHSDVIRLEQNSYYYLLRRYLESVYSGCEARSAFIQLIKKVSDVERLNQFIIGVYLNVNPSQVEPLLREIFDLKNH